MAEEDKIYECTICGHLTRSKSEATKHQDEHKSEGKSK